MQTKRTYVPPVLTIQILRTEDLMTVSEEEACDINITFEALWSNAFPE